MTIEIYLGFTNNQLKITDNVDCLPPDVHLIENRTVNNFQEFDELIEYYKTQGFDIEIETGI